MTPGAEPPHENQVDKVGSARRNRCACMVRFPSFAQSATHSSFFTPEVQRVCPSLQEFNVRDLKP